MTFEQWLLEVDRIAHEKYEFKEPHITATTGIECWRGYYESGETPEGAFRENMSNA